MKQIIELEDKFIRDDGAEVAKEVWAYLKPTVESSMVRELNKNGIKDGGARRIYFAYCLDYKNSINPLNH